MSDQSRRKLLKSIAVGSGAVIAGKSLPETWTKPVVDSVVLPGHAQTSVVSYFSATASRVPRATLGTENKSLLAKVIDSTISKANAGTSGIPQPVQLSVVINGEIASIEFSSRRDDISFKSECPIGGGFKPVTVGQNPCEYMVECGPQQAQVLGYNLGDPNISIEVVSSGCGEDDGWIATAPQGSGAVIINIGNCGD